MRSVDTLPLARIDCKLHYEGYFNCESSCRLRVYTAGDGVPVIVLTELAENPGTSITNASERAQYLAWARIGKPWPAVFVEHYPGSPGGRPDETFGRGEHADVVTFVGTSGDGPSVVNGWMIAGRGLPAFLKPDWKRLPMVDFARLLGTERR